MSHPPEGRLSLPASGRESHFAFWIATLTAVTTGVSFLAAILTPPGSGPFCTASCVAYPYTDIAARIPRDFLWMYPALLPAPLFVILLIAIHDGAPAVQGRFGRVASPLE
jgi:hypothetical protein